MNVKTKDLDGFLNHVFGADCFVEDFPVLLTEKGVPVKKINEFYYIIDDQGNIIHNTCFFSDEEMECLELTQSQNATLH